MLLYARIQALNNKGAPGWLKGPKKLPKMAKKRLKWAFFWVYSEVTSDSRDFDKANVIVC